jgi:hypothetical protein
MESSSKRDKRKEREEHSRTRERSSLVKEHKKSIPSE